MKKWIVIFFVMSCHFFANASAAEEKPVNVGFVVGIPPFVVGDSGILVDLVTEALGRSGYKVVNYEFPSKQFDQDPLNAFEELDIFIGTPLSFRVDYSYGKVYEFDNVAVSKASSQLKIDRISDLKGKYIVGFNNANQHLKEPFTTFHNQELKNWEGYKEIENQQSQFDMLMKDRTQVILLDRSMAYYYARRAGVKNMEGLVFHEIFPLKNAIYVVGRDQEYIQLISSNLESMRKDGKLDELLKNYR
ncbi:transporter substrate-binding domain-containing protein [Vibrio penaeicida]|uniref:substrate-binding periplasmic protein n=1 Tax=Vibrio penaeicida TaxID=104609 RepID=UPI002737418C|nr:transporter substrate-binding domain-containing protein [Vibrio penaeicida]MDP2571995.1 transporter substrate-binding domain-containing protein [Vibrio penaeicida]